MSGNIIELAFGSEISATSEELVYRFDYGQKIHFTDLELPEYFEVHFSNSRQGKATKQIGHNNVVDIPDAYLEKGSVYGWIFLHSTESDGETEYEFKIPVKNRATPSDGEVTPEQESVISQAIAALTATEVEVQSLHDETLGYKNDASSSASAASGYADNSAASATASSGYADNASASALSASGYADSASGYADAAEGYAESASGYADDAEAAKDAVLGMSATATTLPAGSSATASYEDGVLTLGIPRGADGQDGQDGQDGRDGVDGQNGQDGADGSGIASVVKTSTSGLVDTYTITFDDGRTTTFDITNGEDGQDGTDGDTGATPNISIGTVETLEPTESATASMSGTAENPVLNLGIPQGRQGEVTLSQLEQILPTDTASGSIASFSDGSSLFNAKSVVIGIEPIQDLHGYDKPWSGGNGDNKFDYAKASFNASVPAYGFTISVSGTTVTVQGTAIGSGDRAFLIVNGYADDSLGGKGYVCQALDVSGTHTINNAWGFRTETEKSFAILLSNVTDGETVNVTFKISVAETSQTSWTPYSNICPISGWTGAEVNISGFNVWDEEWELGKYDASGQKVSDSSLIRSKNYISVAPNTTYYMLVPYTSYVAGFAVINYYDSDKNFLSRTNVGSNGVSFTTPNNAYYATFFVSSLYGNTYNHDISINYPSTDHEYHAYHGTTYPISWQTEAGTVYGGRLDVVSGEMTDSMRTADLGSLSWEYLPVSSTFPYGLFYTSLYWKAYGESNYLTECYGLSNNDFLVDKATIGNAGGNTIYIMDSSFNGDITAFKSSLNGKRIVYERKDPQTYNLTQTDIALLQGQNNVWADCGDTEVTYKADIQGYIDKKINALI